MVRKELDRLLDDILGDDPKRALAAYRDLADRQLPWLEQRVVALARREHMSWAAIGRLLGRSRQGVHDRFSTIVARPAPPRREAWWERAAREQEAAFLRLMKPPATIDDDPIAW